MAGDSKKKRTRNWVCIVYPESAPENWKEILRDAKVPGAISPLHDADVNPDGTKKKPHWHVLLSFSGVKTQKQVREITDKLNAPAPQACLDIRGTCRYMCHMDNPEKAQYEPNDVVAFGGFDYITKITGTADTDEAIREMMRWCIEQQCDSFYQLANYAADKKPDWFRVITTSRTVFLSAWLKSMSWDMRRNGAGFLYETKVSRHSDDGDDSDAEA